MLLLSLLLAACFREEEMEEEDGRTVAVADFPAKAAVIRQKAFNLVISLYSGAGLVAKMARLLLPTAAAGEESQEVRRALEASRPEIHHWLTHSPSSKKASTGSLEVRNMSEQTWMM